MTSTAHGTSTSAPGGQTTLVSTGPDEVLPDPNYSERAPDAEFLGASTDGATVYFATFQQLTADDTEKMTSDIYSWRDGVTKRITHTKSYPPQPGQPFESFGNSDTFTGASEDGSIFYLAHSPQAADDTDSYADIYRARPDGTSERLGINAGPTPDTGMYLNPLIPGAVSQDGKRLYFTTTSGAASRRQGRRSRHLPAPDRERPAAPGQRRARRGTARGRRTHLQRRLPGRQARLLLDLGTADAGRHRRRGRRLRMGRRPRPAGDPGGRRQTGRLVLPKHLAERPLHRLQHLRRAGPRRRRHEERPLPGRHGRRIRRAAPPPPRPDPARGAAIAASAGCASSAPSRSRRGCGSPPPGPSAMGLPT